MRGGLLSAGTADTRRVWECDKDPNPSPSAPTSEGEDDTSLRCPVDNGAQENETGEILSAGTSRARHLSGEGDEDLEPPPSSTMCKSEEDAGLRRRMSAGIEENARLSVQAAAVLQDKAYARDLFDSEKDSQ